MNVKLDELLAKCTPENRHEEIDFGSPRPTKASAALARFLSDMDLSSPKMDDDYSLRLAEMRALLEPRESIKVKRLHPDAVIPKKAHVHDAGFDLVALEDTIVEPGETALIKTGLAFELPEGYEMQIRPRSGVTLKTKLRVQLGTVDSNYRGEVGVIVDNSFSRKWAEILYGIDGNPIQDKHVNYPNTTGSYLIRKGDRIAQAIIQRLPNVELFEGKALGESDRGEGGFGSSGISSFEDNYGNTRCRKCGTNVEGGYCDCILKEDE